VVSLPQQAARVLADVVSIYPERNEALINAGVIVLAREASAFPGFGKVVNDSLNWDVVRVSQEHGILGCGNSLQKVENSFRVGQKVFIWCQHSCITAAAMYVFYVVDEQDVVRETWVPWKGW
jgi:D-serine deaminase-like pyridoxal phosphate-dependent protein